MKGWKHYLIGAAITIALIIGFKTIGKSHPNVISNNL